MLPYWGLHRTCKISCSSRSMNSLDSVISRQFLMDDKKFLLMLSYDAVVKIYVLFYLLE